MTSLRKLFGDKRGNALLLMGAGLPMLIGAAGLASDTIQWSLWKRQLQKAADSAALAAVYAKMSSQDVPAAVNYDLGDTAGSLSKSNRTGYALLAAPTIGYPANPSGGTNSVSVQLQMQHALSFTSVFMSTAPVIEANATAAAVVRANHRTPTRPLIAAPAAAANGRRIHGFKAL